MGDEKATGDQPDKVHEGLSLLFAHRMVLLH